MILKFAASSALSMCLVAGAFAEPVGLQSEFRGISGLEQDRQSAFSLNLRIPFGPNADWRKTEQAPRIGLSLAPNWNAQRAWSETPSNGIGFTYTGELYADFGGETLSFVDAAIRMGVDEEEAKKKGSAAPWIIGGLVVVGGTAFLVGEINNDTKDTVRCIVDALTGQERCGS